MFGNWKMSLKSVTKHFIFRAIYLIVVPVSIYIFCFFLHFKFLFRSGPGNANMSSLFQAGLEGTELGKSPLQVAFGSKITLRSSAYGAGILHSHASNYPDGSKQQQITLYGHNDENNDWIIHRSYNQTISPLKNHHPLYTDENYEVEFLKDGDHVRLFHNSTGKYLHSHFINARVSSTDLEVTGYGKLLHEDPNDIWVVEIAEDHYKGKGQDEKIIRSLFSQLRFRHLSTGCYLRSSGLSYPEWGFRHGEVTCKTNVKGRELKKKEFLWNVESHTNSHLPEGTPGTYKSRFFDDFIEHNIGMWRTNNALIPDSELEPSALTSKPYHWMFLLRGLRMSGFSDDAVKFYMLGNPMIWWLSAVAITALMFLSLGYFVLSQRNYIIPFESDEEIDQFIYRLQVTVGGWAFNYLPFFLMGRVTYLHHYYPALLFAIISFGFLFEHLTRNISPKARSVLALSFTIAAAGVFLFYSSMAYGFEGPVSNFAKGRKLLNSWNL